MKGVLESLPLADVKADDYAAIFLPGGHGTCGDFHGAVGLVSGRGAGRRVMGVGRMEGGEGPSGARPGLAATAVREA